MMHGPINISDFSTLEVLIRLGSSVVIVENKVPKSVWTESETSRMRRQKTTQQGT